VTDAGDLTGPTSTGVDARLSALLCYLAWWVSGVVFLVIERAVRFHAAQSVVLFGGLTALIVVLSVISVAALFVSPIIFQAAWMFSYLVWFGAVLLWMLVLLKTFRGETWRVPFAGDLAARIASREIQGAVVCVSRSGASADTASSRVSA
jgi:uncharacterized membrane protein